ncbi:hypothetical protein R3P38DRAFT_2800947 [Favolaschia claudopus]|uniref:Uncharacterized protein n=1 Tax=Favolaschia claudopus TaxID=2862362 RepID=A0AAV9ZWB9_9AGAR
MLSDMRRSATRDIGCYLYEEGTSFFIQVTSPSSYNNIPSSYKYDVGSARLGAQKAERVARRRGTRGAPTSPSRDTQKTTITEITGSRARDSVGSIAFSPPQQYKPSSIAPNARLVASRLPTISKPVNAEGYLFLRRIVLNPTFATSAGAALALWKRRLDGRRTADPLSGILALVRYTWKEDVLVNELPKHT